MRRVRRLGVLAGVAIAFVFSNAPVSLAQVLKQVPNDALVVLKVNNLQATNVKIGALAKQLGIDQVLPTVADPLSWAEGEFKLDKGVNKAGDMAVVFVNPLVA